MVLTRLPVLESHLTEPTSAQGLVLRRSSRGTLARIGFLLFVPPLHRIRSARPVTNQVLKQTQKNPSLFARVLPSNASSIESAIRIHVWAESLACFQRTHLSRDCQFPWPADASNGHAQRIEEPTCQLVACRTLAEAVEFAVCLLWRCPNFTTRDFFPSPTIVD